MAASEILDIKVGADTGDAQRSIAELATGVERLAESGGGEIGAKAGEAAGRLRALGQQEGLLRKFSAFARRSQEHGARVQPPSHAPAECRGRVVTPAAGQDDSYTLQQSESSPAFVTGNAVIPSYFRV